MFSDLPTHCHIFPENYATQKYDKILKLISEVFLLYHVVLNRELKSTVHDAEKIACTVGRSCVLILSGYRERGLCRGPCNILHCAFPERAHRSFTTFRTCNRTFLACKWKSVAYLLDGYDVQVCLLSLVVPHATALIVQIQMATLLAMSKRNVFSSFKKQSLPHKSRKYFVHIDVKICVWHSHFFEKAC